MRKIWLLWLLLSGCAPGIESAPLYLNRPIYAQKKDSEQFIRVLTGERKQLAASVERTDGTQDKKALSWRSEDTRIAQVDAQGILTGINPGQTTLILRSSERPERQVRITVEVEARPPENENQGDVLSDTSVQ